MNKTIEETLIIDEGLVLKIYRDHLGYPTVGLGHLISNDPNTSIAHAVILLERELQTALNAEGRITTSEAMHLFRKDLARVNKQIEQASFYAAYRSLDEVRRIAIQNMCFNLGVAGVSKFKKMWNFISSRQYESAANEGLNSKWARQVPNRAQRVMHILRTGTTDHYKGK